MPTPTHHAGDQLTWHERPRLHQPHQFNEGVYAEAAGIPEYINVAKGAQKCVLKINHCKPITNETLVDIATAAVVASGRFERADEDWERKSEDDQAWTNWKPLYLEAHERLRAASEAGEQAQTGR